MAHRTEYAQGMPCWVDLNATDFDGAQRFYGELFGWQFEVGAKESGNYTMCRSDGQLVAGGLEAEARRLGATRLVLETGPRQPEALALYSRGGFVEIPNFGEYAGCEFSVCMAKEL